MNYWAHRTVIVKSKDIMRSDMLIVGAADMLVSLTFVLITQFSGGSITIAVGKHSPAAIIKATHSSGLFSLFKFNLDRGDLSYT